MTQKKSLLLFLLLIGACSLQTSAASAEEDGKASGTEVEAAEKETVLLTEKGLEPSTLTLKTLDGSVFFVNASKLGLASLEVQFNGRRAHCASENMKLQEGTMRSIRPIGPRDFALLCFPERGNYTVNVRGVDGTTKTFTGNVVVP